METLDGRSIEWFSIANRAEYPRKRDTFYPFKVRLLHRFGTFESYYRQIITYECWNGCQTGQSCGRCRDGVYDERQFGLEGWLLGGTVYHVPMPLHLLPKCCQEIHGKIVHRNPPSGEAGHRSMMRLLLRHEPLTWLRAIRNDRMQAIKRGRSLVGYRAKVQCLWARRQALELFPIRRSYDPEPVIQEDVPF